MSAERNGPPFEWSDSDRAKLVPGSTVECNGVKVTCAVAPHRGIRIKWAFGLETRGTQYADLSRADPATIEPPKPTLAEALRAKVEGWRREAVYTREVPCDSLEDERIQRLCAKVIDERADELEAILKEHGA